jgi:hypothetical protein
MRLWPWYKFADQPEAGVYELVMLAGLDHRVIDINDRDRTLLVCKSVNGFLNEAFPISAIMGGKVVQATREEFIAAGGVLKPEDLDDDDEDDG